MPGPGQYQPEVSLEFLDNKKNELNPKSAVFMKKSKESERPVEPGPDVGTYDPIRYNDIGAKETINLVHSSSKKSFGRKMSLASLRRDISPQNNRATGNAEGSLNRLDKRRSIDSSGGRGRNSSYTLNDQSSSMMGPGAYSTIEEE